MDIDEHEIHLKKWIQEEENIQREIEDCAGEIDIGLEIFSDIF